MKIFAYSSEIAKNNKCESSKITLIFPYIMQIIIIILLLVSLVLEFIYISLIMVIIYIISFYLRYLFFRRFSSRMTSFVVIDEKIYILKIIFQNVNVFNLNKFHFKHMDDMSNSNMIYNFLNNINPFYQVYREKQEILKVYSVKEKINGYQVYIEYRDYYYNAIKKEKIYIYKSYNNYEELIKKISLLC